MSSVRRRNILISIPGKSRRSVYLPTIWANLKTYCEQSHSVADSVRWLDPIVIKDRPEKLLAGYDDDPIDVLGLSCYCWNSDTNYELARLVRKRFPRCLIVAGGPDPDYKNTDYFRIHPEVDALVIQDGEISFRRMLEQLAEGRLDLESIPGLVLPAPESALPIAGAGYRSTGSAELLRDFGRSPWLANADYFARTIRRLRREEPECKIIISWETDRGCPYHCTFCDWGSSTYSKVRAVDLARLREEALWIGEQGIDIVSFTAANFGILLQDQDVVEALIEARRRYGYPRSLQWNNAKNNVERVIAISEKAYAVGLIDFHVLSIQTLDEDVLKAMDRANIRKERQLAIVDTLKGKGVPSVVQLIYGGPADGPEKFFGTLTELMEWGIHDEYVAYPFMILPNAPANEPGYRETWGIRTIRRYGTVNKRRRNDLLADGGDRSHFVVAANSFTVDEYVEMYLIGRLIIALHNGGITQLIARYLRRTHDVAYGAFYGALIDRLFGDPSTPSGEAYQRCRDHIAAFVGPDGEERFEQIELTEVPKCDYLLNIDEYLLVKIMLNLNDFYEDVRAVVETAFGDIDALDSLISYQRAMMIDPGYDRRAGRVVVLAHDWPGYFAREACREEVLPVLVAFEHARSATILQQASGSHGQYPLDWFERSDGEEDLLRHWVDAIAGSEYTRAYRAVFKGPSRVDEVPRAGVHAPTPAHAAGIDAPSPYGMEHAR